MEGHKQHRQIIVVAPPPQLQLLVPNGRDDDSGYRWVSDLDSRYKPWNGAVVERLYVGVIAP